MWYNFLLRWRNPDSASNRRGWPQGPTQRLSLMPCLLLLEDRTMPSTLTVLNNADGGAGSLRAAIADAQSGDQIVFDKGLQGQTITLTSGELRIAKGLDIEGLGAEKLAVSGNYQSRIFDISGGVTVTIAGLTITAGMVAPGNADALGGGIFNNGGDLTLDNVVVQNNVARGGDEVAGANGYSAQGAGVYSNGGALTLAGTTITNNQALGGRGGYASYRGGDGGGAAGGGIYTTDGPLTIADSTIASNSATGGRGGDGTGCGFGSGSCFGGNGGVSQGGGLYLSGGMLTVNDSSISTNALTGSDGGFAYGGGGSGGASQGGGMYVSGTLTLSGSTITSNTVTGSPMYGGAGKGGGMYVSGTLTLSDSMIIGNTLTGAGYGGVSQGGGMYVSGTLTVSDSMILGNTLTGGSFGGASQASQGGGMYVSGRLTASNSMITGNTLTGGSDGGSSQGGGMYISGTLTLSDSTIARNNLTGGGRTGGASQGGGMYVSGMQTTLTIRNSTIAANTVSGGESDFGAGGVGQGSGLYISGMQTTVTVSNTTIAANTARGGDGRNGGAGQGGGLWVAAGATAQISFSTIATNRATGGGLGGSNGAASGGGLYNQGMLQTRDTILFGNMVTGRGTNSGPDLAGDLGSLGHNLIGNSDGGTGFDATDLLDIDPLLGLLQDNGGPTQTMALLPGSPAIGAGDKTGHPRWDQRGRPYRRVVNHRMDIGAFEVQSDSPESPAPGHGGGAGSSLAPLVSGLLLSPHSLVLAPVATLPGPAVVPDWTRGVMPKQELESAPRAVAVVRFFASLEEQAHAPKPAQWPDLESIQSFGSNQVLVAQDASLVLMGWDDHIR